MGLIFAWFCDLLISFGGASPSAIGLVLRTKEKIQCRRNIYRLTPHKINSRELFREKKENFRRR